MPIRFREKYGTYQVYWRDAAGHQCNKSFPTKKQAVAYEKSRLREACSGDKKGKRDEKEKESIATQILPEGSAGTLTAVYLQYLRERQFSKKDMKNNLGNSRPWLALLGDKPVEQITVQDLNKVKAHFLSVYTQATAHNRLCILRTVMYFAADHGYCEKIAFPKIPGAHYQRFIPPSPEEIAKIYAVAPEHIRRVLVLGSAIGMRIGPCELFGMTWDDVDWERNVIRVHGAKKNADAPYREVPMRSDLRDLLKRWRLSSPRETYLISYMGEKVTSIKTSWKNALRRAGITRRIRPYDLRHAFGTELVAAGVDINTVAHLMGHSSPAMLLKHYLYVLDKAKVAAMESLPSLPTAALGRQTTCNIIQKRRIA